MRRLLVVLSLLLYAAPALSQESTDDGRTSIEVTAAVQNRWLFPEQLLTQADNPEAEISATLTHHDWSVTAWYGREIKDANNSELDILISPPDIRISDTVTLDSTVGVYFIPGDEAFVAEAGISTPVADGWTIRASYQGVRGGFVENLAAVELSGEVSLTENLTLDITPMAFYSDYAQSAGASLAVGVTYQASESLGIRAFTLGYAGGGYSDIAFGISLVLTR